MSGLGPNGVVRGASDADTGRLTDYHITGTSHLLDDAFQTGIALVYVD